MRMFGFTEVKSNLGITRNPRNPVREAFRSSAQRIKYSARAVLLAALSAIEGGRFRGKDEEDEQVETAGNGGKKDRSRREDDLGWEATIEERMKGQQAVTKENNR